ncbi:ABC transporter substrate-binding protein [Paenibacillus sp. FJAT-26967]|uniref:ABC transporter substrate-binding protein n=1 Tax=Paenibacillus sp. FJAT-26967 TaxID=1729690 RepID=UPI0008390132|nr:NrtA/SsuA/CpmA family ABC transporter substrate-binding protein [Paenibacillus sp. FJAT-26967]
MGKLAQKKTSFKLSTILALISLVLLAAACGKAEADPSGGQEAGKIPTVLRIGYIGSTKLNLPGGAEGWGFYTGITKQELQKHGITDVQFVGFPSGPDLSESLISGRIDIGSLGDTPAVLAKSAGAPSKMITLNAANSNAFILAKKGGPANLAELKGKKLSVKKGSYMHRYVAGLLKEQGIKDVQLIHLLDEDADAALVRGEVDAIATTEVRGLKMIPQGYPVLDEALKDHPDLVGGSITVVSESYLKKFPDIPKVWNDLRVKALEDLQTKEEDYYAFLVENTGNSLELVRKTSAIGRIQKETFTEKGLEQLKAAKDFLVSDKLAENDFSIEEWIAK